MLLFCSTNFPVCGRRPLRFPKTLISQNGLQSKLRKSYFQDLNRFYLFLLVFNLSVNYYNLQKGDCQENGN